VTATERVAFSRLRLYEHYDRDEELREALLRFHGYWWTKFGRALRRLDDCLPDLDDAERELADLVGAVTAHAYLGDLGILAAEAGLDRIPMVGPPPAAVAGYLPSGIGQAHRFVWQLDKALAWEAAGPKALSRAVRRPSFVALASFGTPIPAVDTSIAGTTARWDPRTELLRDARHRLLSETDLASETIRAELARIGEDGGYEFPDTSTQRRGIWRLDRDALWTWWRIRWGWTYAQIAEEWERLHPGDHRLEPRADVFAQEWEAMNPGELGSLVAPADANRLVRKAVTTFAERARVDFRTAPSRRGTAESVSAGERHLVEVGSSLSESAAVSISGKSEG
jgi:hypothetical protein